MEKPLLGDLGVLLTPSTTVKMQLSELTAQIKL